jgi:myo-inositol 2-dehydrogenase/D-chiro-inositol 1-dehydrogenase
MSRLNIGIVGAGYMGALHAKILARDERVRVAAVFDLMPERAEACAREHGAHAVPSADALMETVDAVYITTPNTKHVELTLAALEAERHIFCEKPLATSRQEARRVLEASQRSRGLFQVGHNRRFAPVYQEVKKFIAPERMRPHSVHSKMNRGELLNPPWISDPAITGGFLYETTIHMFDMLRWLFGEVESVTVYAASHEYPEIDDFSMLVRFRCGLHATLASSADASWHFPFERLEVYCHHATIETQEMDRVSWTAGLDVQPVTQSFDQLEREWRWGYVQEDRAFVEAILTGGPAPVTALDGFKAVELVDACYQAAHTGERVWLSS